MLNKEPFDPTEAAANLYRVQNVDLVSFRITRVLRMRGIKSCTICLLSDGQPKLQYMFIRLEMLSKVEVDLVFLSPWEDS